MADTTHDTTPPWYPLAADALLAARDERWHDARQHLQRIADTYGAEVIPDLLIAWIDTMLKHTPGPERAPALGRLGFMDAVSGRIVEAEHVDPAVCWAGRLVFARYLDDQEQFSALIESVDSDQQWSNNVAAILNVCGTMLRWATP
ncbi:hypothetical protein GCM10012275_38420 [Longimycelium tulufanense]|uniref:Uncharacterized protein n=1 Tax=Longimycelium tulufanense TaxID=907463 RepID=A0A8J3CAB8_9PSEU|nr:hypothetical protein [Longimycelium tulufanense]GGM64190.1 hypothetical protein GCM10012275_38420 [Longimycelium tulufanense]